MAGWPRNHQGQQGYFGSRFPPGMPGFAPAGPIMYDQRYYGGTGEPSMNPGNNYYPNPLAQLIPPNNIQTQQFPPTTVPLTRHPAPSPVVNNTGGPNMSFLQTPNMSGPVTSVPTTSGAALMPQSQSQPPMVNYASVPVEEREKEILEFWQKRFTKTEKDLKRPFPDAFVLRLVVGLDKRAVEGLEVLFKEGNCLPMLIFEEDPPSKGNVPNHLRYLCRCRWNPKQKWIVGYGSTPAEAKNEAAVEGLKLLLTPEEYSLIVEMNRPERFISLDAQKLAQALNQYAVSVNEKRENPDDEMKQVKKRRKRRTKLMIQQEAEAAAMAALRRDSNETSDGVEIIEDRGQIGDGQVEAPEESAIMDSDYSIGGSGSELTGDEDEYDEIPPEKMKLIRLRKNLYDRENRIIKYWLSKRPDSERRPFPDLFRLRNMRNVGKRSRQAVLNIFQSFQRHLRPVFQNESNNRPDLGYFHCRCSWDNFKQNVHGYGNTPEQAENDAGVKTLITVMGEEEYAMLEQMTRDELYDGLDMTRIHAHIAYRNNQKAGAQRPLTSSRRTTPGFNFESELINYPKILKVFPPVGISDVPKPQFKLLSKKLRNYGKAEPLTGFYSVDKIAPFQIFEKLSSIEDLKDNAVSALGSLFAGLPEPIPSYCSTIDPLNNRVKVECVARRKYFVEEASTEESAKNSAALSALKFLVGSGALEKLLKAQADRLKA